MNLDNIEFKNRFNIKNLLETEINLFGKKLNDKKKERYYSDLYTLFTAGVDFKSALELMEEEQHKKIDKVIFKTIKDEVIRGKGLSKAMEESGYFSNYEYFSIKIGEESGKINDVLKELAVYFTKKIKLKRQLVSVFAYPLFVLAISLGVVYFMLNNIVPMFSDVFNRFGGELPQITKIVIKFSEFFSAYFSRIFILIIILGFITFTIRKKEVFRKFSSKIALKLPIFGKILRKIYLARFSHSMYLLISSKTPLVKSINLVEKMIEFYPLEIALQQIEKNIIKGTPLHKSMSSFKIFDKRMVSLIKVSEEVNQLEMMFEKISKQYTDEVEYQSSIMGSLLEPLLIIFIAIFVGIILIAIYLPLFELSTSIG
jgi:type IV pilus assembly protein PilC